MEVSPIIEKLQIPNDVHPSHEEDRTILGMYLEVPALSRRRRSHQVSISSDFDGSHTLPDTSEEVEVFDDDIFDSPRLFIEMVTLSESLGSNEVALWKEAARWVRFEEDVEDGGQRWSKARVSTLSLHSFFELRSFLVNGIISLEVEGTSLPEIFRNALNQTSWAKRLSEDKLIQVEETLKCKCVHLFELSRNKMENVSFKKRNKPGKLEGLVKDTDDFSRGDDFKSNKQFMKKLTKGTEAANIFVGEVQYLDKVLCAFIRLKNVVNLGNFTEVPVASRFVFVILGPLGDFEQLQEIGRCISTLLSDEVFREVAYKARTKFHIMAGMDEFLDASTLLPPGEWDPCIRIEPPKIAPTKESRKKKVEIDNEEAEEQRYREAAGLTRTGRLFGGLINDIKRKAPWYLSDYKDALSMQGVASLFFLYFACLTPIVTFGGLLGEATGNNIAVMESLLSGLICGLLYGLFSGQPLTVLGSTGPVLVFESIIFDFCQRQDWNFMSFRFWIGLWASLILLILVAIDASALVCYITRFTEENFATLISLIFVYKAFEKVIMIGFKYPMETYPHLEKYCECIFPTNGTEYMAGSRNITEGYTTLECKAMNGTLVGDGCQTFYPNVFLLSVLLFAGTFFMSTTLKNFKSATFFPSKVRCFISDFAVISTISMMTVLDYNLGMDTPKLEVPSELRPTNPERGWLIYPFNGNPWWTSLAAAAPALLACILIFMDQQITSVIVNRKENKLKKGGGYHLDLLVLSLLVAINSVMGLPWFVAATVLSVNHVDSLKLESECAAPGEKPQFLGVRENRLTHLLIFIFIGLSCVMARLLQKIPMPVLFGVFLYMGLAALKGIQLFDRILIMFMPLKYQPDHTYLRKVPLKRVHLFTLIQLTCFILLWLIKSFKEASILFPLMLVVMVGIRKMLDLVFTQRELKILDDALPEYTRKKKMDEEESDDDEPKKPTLSVTLVNGCHINITDELNKSELWSKINNTSITPSNSASNSRRGSESLRCRRRSSILEPIFATHNYEGDSSQQVPNDGEPFHQRNRASRKEALTEEETEALFQN